MYAFVSGLGSFTCKAKDHDGVVLSIACASAFLQFPEFSKVEDANAKKAYADVLEALFWVATTASNEEIVFSNKEEKNKDASSSLTLADEADDRRLRVNDAFVVAINSEESNGILAGQTISNLIEKALFDESNGTAALELCLGDRDHKQERHEHQRTTIVS